MKKCQNIISEARISPKNATGTCGGQVESRNIIQLPPKAGIPAKTGKVASLNLFHASMFPFRYVRRNSRPTCWLRGTVYYNGTPDVTCHIKDKSVTSKTISCREEPEERYLTARNMGELHVTVYDNNSLRISDSERIKKHLDRCFIFFYVT
jgi:hypothetical protein